MYLGTNLIRTLSTIYLANHTSKNSSKRPNSPTLPANTVLVRYAYDGGTHSQGRLCKLTIHSKHEVKHHAEEKQNGGSKKYDRKMEHSDQMKYQEVAEQRQVEMEMEKQQEEQEEEEEEEEESLFVTASQVMKALENDGVDFERFYATVYEMDVSDGGWLPLVPLNNSFYKARRVPPGSEYNVERVESKRKDELIIPLTSSSRRIDIKLFRRDDFHQCIDAAKTHQNAQPSGKINVPTGYFGVGVVGCKTEANIGTLWRSAYQLGASFLMNIGSRYDKQSTDTVQSTRRLPLFEFSDFADFAPFSPRGVKWVAIEMGGTPLEEFDHPKNAMYFLGSEDGGLPLSISRACHETVSIESERYPSYNVAVAGSIVLYDRMVKMRKKGYMKPEDYPSPSHIHDYGGNVIFPN